MKKEEYYEELEKCLLRILSTGDPCRYNFEETYCDAHKIRIVVDGYCPYARAMNIVTKGYEGKSRGSSDQR